VNLYYFLSYWPPNLNTLHIHVNSMDCLNFLRMPLMLFNFYSDILFVYAECQQNCETCVAISNTETRCEDCIDNYQFISTTSDVNDVGVAGKCYSMCNIIIYIDESLSVLMPLSFTIFAYTFHMCYHFVCIC